MKFLNDLNPQQKEAVLHGDGPLLILAGAGSGKTKTLAYRIARLIHDGGVAPGEIFAVTFTNKAAKEMRHRVEAVVKGRTKGMWLATFHSVCARLLRENPGALGFGKNFNIIDDSDSVGIIKSCMKDLNISDRLFSPRAVAGRISSLKNVITTPDDFAATAQPFGFDGKVAKIYPMYQERLMASEVLDFDDLLMQSVILLQKNRKVLLKYQDAFKHILVDEYQDTNKAQYLLVKLLSGKHRNICVVGDDDQSIYRFRGADLRNILEFEKDFPDAKVVKLEQNYRSTQNILDSAWSLVCNNPGRKPKKLWTDLGKGEKVEYMRTSDEESEALQIAREIKKSVKDGMTYSDFAVLYRTNTQSRTVEEAFRREAVPYVVMGGMKFYDRKEVKDVINYLKAISNPKDSVSLKKIVNTPPRGIGEATMKKAAQLAQPDNVQLIDCLAKLLDDDSLSTGPKKRISEFLALFEGFREAKKSLTPHKLASKVLAEVGYFEYLRESLGSEAQGRIDNIKELLASIEDFEKDSEKPLLEDYLAQVALITDWDKTKENVPTVTMMTLHLSKGLEFPVVFVTGLEEGLIPHAHSNSDDSELEEERRLLYVGMTRARKKLYLTNASTRKLAGLTQSNPPSRFIEELPDKMLIRRKPELAKRQSAADYKADASNSVRYCRPVAASAGGSAPVGMYKCGCLVSHPIWGSGVIEKSEGRGEEMKVTVLFKSVGKKKLMAKMANLVRV